MSDPFQPRDVLLPYGIFLGILLVAALVPPLGMVVGIFTPVPLILIYLQRGKQIGVLSIAVVFLALWWLVGMQQAVVFIAEYAVMALVLGETIRLRFPFERCVLYGGLSSALLSAVFILIVAGGQDESILEFFEKEIRQSMELYFQTLRESEVPPEELEEIRAFTGSAGKFFAAAFPAVIAVGSLFAALGNYLVVRWLWGRFYTRDYFSGVDLSRWALPDSLVWLFIVATGSLFLEEGALNVTGINVFIIMLALYLLQGLAIILSFLRNRQVPRLFWVLVFVLIMIQPLFMGMTIGLGLFDIWVDFRKIRQPELENPEE